MKNLISLITGIIRWLKFLSKVLLFKLIVVYWLHKKKPQIIGDVVSIELRQTPPKRFKNVKNPKIILNHLDVQVITKEGHKCGCERSC